MAKEIEIKIPDIGGSTGVDVIDILVKPGMHIEKEQSLITLEGDKATMEIPAPHSGIVKQVKVKLGDKVSQGDLILLLESDSESDSKTSAAAPSPAQAPAPAVEQKEQSPKQVEEEPKRQASSALAVSELHQSAEMAPLVAAGPAVRRMAREFGLDLALIPGSGRKGRISKEDLQTYVKTQLSDKQSGAGFAFPKSPSIDFSKFGDIEVKPLNKIKKITGANLHRSWITVPHVTQFDEADISQIEALRKAESEKKNGSKLTILAFVCAVVAKALKVYPQFNASLDPSGEQLIYKKYYNLGIAVETPNGLVVPVIKEVDKLGIRELAAEMTRLSTKAREKGLSPDDMAGACFTISSLGGIGGTYFTPIVNSPEVAILGLSRSSIKPVFEQGEFKPKLMLPLSLSYDHRVIDGAEAARFVRFIAECLGDMARVLL